jgi:gliding motility-associated-like protein
MTEEKLSTYLESEIIAINNDTDHQIGNYSQYVLETNRIIYVVIKSQIGCSQIVKLDLKLVNSPEIEISDTLSLCDSEKLIVDAGSGFDSYLWSDGSTSSSLNIVEPGNYSIKAGYDYGTKECFTTKFFTVTNSGNPEVTAIDIVNQKQNSNNLVVTASGTPPMYYSLDNEHYYESADFNNLDTGSYTVYVKNGCGIISKHIDIFFYPSFFTPNGDDKNDGWFIKYSTREYGIRVYIYDRYGKLVSNLKQGEVWDGTYKNQNLPATDYWFVAEKNGKILHKGHFSLIR